MIGIDVDIQGFQQASDALEQELKALMKDQSVLIGIHEGEGQADGGDLTMAQLGAILHFGTDRAGANHDVVIPARPWLDVGVESGRRDYVSIMEDNADDMEKALNLVGQVAVARVQKYIVDLKTPPNAESTIRKKGASNPLIDTGAMMQSVSYSIVKDIPEEGL